MLNWGFDIFKYDTDAFNAMLKFAGQEVYHNTAKEKCSNNKH